MIELIYTPIVVSPTCWQSGFILAYSMAKGRLYCLVSGVVVKRKGNITRALNSLLAPSAKLLSAQKWFQAYNSSHTLYPPTLWKMKQFGIMILLEWVGATGKSAVFMFGMQKLEVTRKAPSCQRQGEVHMYSSTGWQLDVQNVHKNLFTEAQIKQGKVIDFTLTCDKWCWVSDSLHREMIVSDSTYLWMIIESDSFLCSV